MEYGKLQRELFSKSSQWVGLTRMHAMLVVEDDHVWPRFDRFCRTGVRCRFPCNVSYSSRVCPPPPGRAGVRCSLLRDAHAELCCVVAGLPGR